jgi:hypothetical protein
MADDCIEPDLAAQFDRDEHFVRAPGVLWRHVAGTVLLRTLTDPGIVELSGSSVLIWLALGNPVSAGELASDLSAVVGARLDVVAAEMRPVLHDLLQRGFVTRLDRSS